MNLPYLQFKINGDHPVSMVLFTGVSSTHIVPKTIRLSSDEIGIIMGIADGALQHYSIHAIKFIKIQTPFEIISKHNS